MSKLINIADEVYLTLTKMKGSESYSKVIKSLIEGKSNKDKILSFAGKGGIDKAKVEELRDSWGKWSEKFA